MIDLKQHPHYNIPLNKLIQERNRIIEFNKRISKKDYKFKSTIKPNYPKYLDLMIELKKNDAIQLKLF